MVNKKILIIHDRFQFRGGAERLILTLAQDLGADIATEYWEVKETYSKSEVPAKLFVLDNSEPPAIVWRYFRAQKNFFYKTKDFIKNYDLVIFSGNNSLSASFNLAPFWSPLVKGASKNVKKIYYCHSPVRYVYDLFKIRRKSEPSFLKKFIYYDLGKYLIRFFYRLGLKQMDIVLANSINVQNRLKKYCNTNSQVVYPPIETNKFKWLGQKDYYLSFARLDELTNDCDCLCGTLRICSLDIAKA